nr:capsid protein [Alphapermutotetravirus sp.]
MSGPGMDPKEMFYTLVSKVLPMEERAGAPDDTAVDRKQLWKSVSDRLNSEETAWVNMCREDPELLKLAWFTVVAGMKDKPIIDSMLMAVKSFSVPISPHYYKCGGCNEDRAISVEHGSLVLDCDCAYCCELRCMRRPTCVVDGWLKCGCCSWCSCRCVNRGRGSLTTCGDVEENPGPDEVGLNLAQVVKALEGLNINVTISHTSTKRTGKKPSKSKGRGSLMTNGDIEENPGPTIQTDKVVIEPRAPQKPRKRQRRRRKQQTKEVIPEGQVQIMGRNMIRRGKVTIDTGSVPEYTKGFLERHLDPCGEYRTALDYGKCPDGTLPQSASGQFREVFTIRAPGVSETEVNLTGQMWSLAILSPPLWRVCQVLVADMNRAEVGDAALSSAISYLNFFGDDDAQYPTWAETETSGVYVSVVRWKALIGAPEPSDLGVSPLISDFRITGEGFTVSHNTPSLIDQGIAVVAQFNPNVEPRSLALAIDEGVTAVQWVGSFRVTTPTEVRYAGLLPGLGQYPWHFETTTIVPAVGQTVNSSVLGIATADFTVNGAMIFAQGDSLRWQTRRLATNTLTVQLQAGTGSPLVWSDTPLAPIAVQTNGITANVTAKGILGEVVEHLVKANVVTMPPITQEDLIQMTPKTVQFLLKDTRGFYVVKRVWQPVLNMTKASSYGPLRFITQDSTLNDVSGILGGIQDTFDANYGFAVCSLSSLPIACAPYVKAIRSWEVVPSRGSSWGPFTTSTSPKDDNAMLIARTVSDLDPFAYPHDYNGFGLLFAKVCKIVAKIPRALRTGAAVADKVAQVCEGIQGITSTVSAARTNARADLRSQML